MRIFVAVAFAAACAPARAQQRPASGVQSAASPWRLTLHVAGGFAGLDRTLELTSAGDTRAIDPRRGTPIASQAEATELAAIASLVTALKSTAPAQRNANCRDCLEYSLDIQRGGERLAFRLDDSNLPGSEAEPLVGAANTMLNRLLSGSGR